MWFFLVYVRNIFVEIISSNYLFKQIISKNRLCIRCVCFSWFLGRLITPLIAVNASILKIQVEKNIFCRIHKRRWSRRLEDALARRQRRWPRTFRTRAQRRGHWRHKIPNGPLRAQLVLVRGRVRASQSSGLQSALAPSQRRQRQRVWDHRLSRSRQSQERLNPRIEERLILRCLVDEDIRSLVLAYHRIWLLP